MTGIAHIELKEVNKCHFLTTKGPQNSYIKLLTIVSYCLNKYPTFVQPFPIKLLLYSIFFNEWKSVKLSLLVLTPPPIHITINQNVRACQRQRSRVGRLNRKHGCITVCLRLGDYTSVVSRTVGSVAISCYVFILDFQFLNVGFYLNGL